MIEQELIKKATGIALIGLASAGYTNNIGLLLLAHDSVKIEDFSRRSNIAIVMNGLFGLMFGLGILFITS